MEEMVTPARFERTTCPLGGDRSIQLSYGAIGAILARSGPRHDARTRKPWPAGGPRGTVAPVPHLPARMDIRLDALRHPAVIALLQEHLDWMRRTSPPESVHALDLEALRGRDISFWAVWDGEQVAGCGALRELDAGHGEVKSMRTAQTHLRQGVAQRMLGHLIEEARRRGYRRLSLETGSMAYFAPARALYARAGFVPCAPFGDYVEDPNSVFMTRTL